MAPALVLPEPAAATPAAPSPRVKNAPATEVPRNETTGKEEDGEMECQLHSLSLGPNPLTGLCSSLFLISMIFSIYSFRSTLCLSLRYHAHRF